MSCKIYKFVLNDTLHQTFKKSHALGYFQICEHLCALECDNSNPNGKIIFYMIEHLMWMSITSYTYDQTRL